MTKPTAMFKLAHGALMGALLLASACAQNESPGGSPAPPPAPWRSAALTSALVPAVYVQQWNSAPNRATCGLFAFAQLGTGAGALPRAATFSGGWAVAYDLPQQRSAFGIAGTGVSASDSTYSEWPFRREWADGSRAGYGPEGGTGPNQLAYLRIAGQGCLYNVWSRLGRAHLEFLLESIRTVTHPSSGKP